jgi:hypothetical protein
MRWHRIAPGRRINPALKTAIPVVNHHHDFHAGPSQPPQHGFARLPSTHGVKKSRTAKQRKGRPTDRYGGKNVVSVPRIA